eukprot:12877286-Alexandrium_andersonii.AAC.1
MLYPINKLRNVALRAAKAGLVLLEDVDFIPSVGLYTTLCPESAPGAQSDQHDSQALRAALSTAHNGGQATALVIPAFEHNTE